MLEDMIERGPELAPEHVARFERQYGLTLPDEYISFLLRYNGGRPTPDCFPIERFYEGSDDSVDTFYGLGQDMEVHNLDWRLETSRGRIPSNLLPIAGTGCGDLICLSLSGDDAGAVLFWDHGGEHRDPTYKNVYMIADSFSSFIEGLFEAGD